MKGISAEQLYALYERSQWWSEKDLITYQRKMLNALLNHARSASHFYRYRLNEALSPSGEISWDNWNRIPILTRADVFKYAKNLQSEKVPAEHLPTYTAKTSGSTGHPISVTTNGFLHAVLLATGWRAQKWHQVDWGKKLLTRDYSLNTTIKNGELTGMWGPPTERPSRSGKNIYFNHGNLEQFFDLMILKQPQYISILSNSIDVLCDIQKKRGAEFDVKMFFARGGKVSSELRRKAADVFSAEILEGYSTQECGSIAYACPTGSGFHINSESVYLEVVREDGTPCALGEEGKVVVTPITSTAMPLIRYDLGDRAILGDKCACGRGLPLLKEISGREMHEFRHPDGRAVPGGIVAQLRSILNILRWQVSQIGPIDFEVRYISEQNLDENEIEIFTEKFRNLVFADSKIDFKRCEELKYMPSGKFIEYMNEWNQSK